MPQSSTRECESMKGKNTLLVLLLFAILPLVPCCQGNSVFNGSRTCDSMGFNLEYSILDRESSADLSLEEGDSLKVIISHEKGSVDIRIANGQNQIYAGSKQANAEFSLVIAETGTYHISVTGHKAKGSVSFTRVLAQEPKE